MGQNRLDGADAPSNPQKESLGKNRESVSIMASKKGHLLHHQTWSILPNET